MDIGTETTLPPEPEKVSPPKPRGKPGRKPGQKTGSGRSASLFRKKAAKEKIPSPEEKLEAIGNQAAEPAAPAKRKGKAANMSPEKFGKTLQFAHQGLAMLTGDPDLKLTDEEAKMLSSAFDDWCEEYDFKVSNKAAVNVNLAGAVIFVYGKKFGALRAKRMKKAKPPAPENPGASVMEAVPAIEPIIDPNMFTDFGG